MLSFRPLRREDLPLLHAWLNRPFVAEWWGGPTSMEEVEQEYGEYLDGVEPIRVYLASIGETPMGHLQWMRYRDYPAYARVLGVDDPDAANCDVLIGEEKFLHRGLGGPLVRQFVREVIFADPTVTRCFIDPDARNAIAIRAYEKAGFRFVRRIEDDGEGHPVHLMEMTR